MSATTIRPTTSLTVAPTQNTALVLDFRCLYTFDLRRKAKRWQDGLARFHTHNKRIMVYDEPRNFIGDTHWRESEPIQDGDELQLDKGVLIQIGEATGRSDQDISGLFEKRKAKERNGEGSSPARSLMTQAVQSSAVVQPLSAVPSYLRPKTLNALLGTPKGRIGRAALPNKSPFQERRIGVENEVQERPSKRQRIMSLHEKRSPPVVAPAPKSSKPPRTITAQPASKPKRPMTRPLPQDVEKGAPSTGRKKITLDNAAGKPRRGKSKPPSPSIANCHPPESVGEAIRSPSRPSTEPKCLRRASPEVIDVDLDSVCGAHGEPPQGARLRIATSKPRKKLMYKDLLPLERSATERTTTRAVETRNSPQRKEKPRKSKSVSSQNEPLSQFHEEQRVRMRQRLEKHNQRNGPPIHEAIEQMNDDLEPLFISDDEFPTPPPNCPQGDDNQLGADMPLSIPDSARHKPPPQPFKDAPIYSPPATHSADIERAKMDTALLQRPKPDHPPPLPAEIVNFHPPRSKPAKPLPPAPPLEKPTLNDLPTIPSAKPLVPPVVPPKANSNPFQRSLSSVITSTINATTKRALRKTVSDTATVLSVPRRDSLTKPVATSVEAAPEPWSREAWDLFGFGREAFVKTGLEGIRSKALA